MKLAALITAIAIAMLGALWLLQGLGIVTMEPILCFADCETVEGPDLAWAITGLVALAIGGMSIWFGIRRKR